MLQALLAFLGFGNFLLEAESRPTPPAPATPAAIVYRPAEGGPIAAPYGVQIPVPSRGAGERAAAGLTPGRPILGGVRGRCEN